MKALSSTRTKKTNSKTQWVKAKNECKPHRGPNGQREWRPPKAFVHLPAAIFTRRTFCVPSKSSATNSFWTSSFNTYTKKLAAPSSLSCTKQFFTPGSFHLKKLVQYITRLLCQTTCGPVFTQDTFHSRELSHKATVTPSKFDTSRIFSTKAFAPGNFDTRQLFHKRPLHRPYTNQPDPISFCQTDVTPNKYSIQPAALDVQEIQLQLLNCHTSHSPQRALISLGTGSSMAKPSSIATLRACRSCKQDATCCLPFAAGCFVVVAAVVAGIRSSCSCRCCCCCRRQSRSSSRRRCCRHSVKVCVGVGVSSSSIIITIVKKYK